MSENPNAGSDTTDRPNTLQIVTLTLSDGRKLVTTGRAILTEEEVRSGKVSVVDAAIGVRPMPAGAKWSDVG